MNTLSRDLMREIECPVCLQYLVPPVTLCLNGHNICHSCRRDVNQCPTCRACFTETKCLTLDKVLRGLRYPCVHQAKGCNKILELEFINEHESVCPVGKHVCPLYKFLPDEKCSWKGYWKDFAEHVESIEHIGLGALINESNFTSDSVTSATVVIFTLGEIFIYRKIKKDGKWFFVMFLIGTRAQAARYKNVFTFRTSDGLESIVKTQKVKGVVEDFDDIVNSYQCLRLEDGDLKKFVECNVINLEVEISLTDK